MRFSRRVDSVRALSLVLFSIGLVLYAKEIGRAQKLSDLVETVKPSIVLVLNYTWLNQIQAYGSGFFVSTDGKIITNKHVILGASRVRVRLLDGKVVDAKILNSSDEPDLALLKVEGSNFPALPFAEFSDIKVLQDVIVIGYPLVENIMSNFQTGIDITATDGKISRIFASSDNQTWLQVTAPINPGNSGGPLVNLAGQVVGVATASHRTAQGFFFAIASHTAQLWMQGKGFTPPTDLPRESSPFNPPAQLSIPDRHELLYFLESPLANENASDAQSDLMGLAYQRSADQWAARALIEFYSKPVEAFALGFELLYKNNFYFFKPYLGVGLGLAYVRGLMGIELDLWFLRVYAEITYNRSLNQLPLEHRKIGLGVAW